MNLEKVWSSRRYEKRVRDQISESLYYMEAEYIVIKGYLLNIRVDADKILRSDMARDAI